MQRIRFIIIITLFIFLLTACSTGDDANKMPDYDTTKKMVVDILQTEDGKKALHEIMSDDKMKQHLVIDSDVVKEAINTMLVSEKGTEMWSKMFKDATFVESFAKSMSDEQKKLFKKIMYDPDFQEQALELLQNPEIDKQMLTVMKSQEFRAHLEETISQTLETPLFQVKVAELLLKAAEKQEKSPDKSDKSGSDPETDTGGGDGGGDNEDESKGGGGG